MNFPTLVAQFRPAVRSLIAAGLLAGAGGASAAVIPVVESGKLVGARNVEVGSLGLYSLRFAFGSCLQVFGADCRPGGFTFTNPADAALAGQALLDQVLVGHYDDAPDATYGCKNAGGCTIATPWGVTTTESRSRWSDGNNWYENYSYYHWVEMAATSNMGRFYIGDNAYGYPDRVSVGSGPEISYFWSELGPLYAVWERQSAPIAVPEPSSLATSALGIALVALLARRRARRAARRG